MLLLFMSAFDCVWGGAGWWLLHGLSFEERISPPKADAVASLSRSWRWRLGGACGWVAVLWRVLTSCARLAAFQLGAFISWMCAFGDRLGQGRGLTVTLEKGEPYAQGASYVSRGSCRWRGGVGRAPRAWDLWQGRKLAAHPHQAPGRPCRVRARSCALGARMLSLGDWHRSASFGAMWRADSVSRQHQVGVGHTGKSKIGSGPQLAAACAR